MNTAARWATKAALALTTFVVITVGGHEVASAQVTAPVDVCGVGVAALGGTSAECSGQAAQAPSDAVTAIVTSNSPAAGTSSVNLLDPVVENLDAAIDADAAVPVNVCGVGVGVLGGTSASCATQQAPAPSNAPVAAIGTEGNSNEPNPALIDAVAEDIDATVDADAAAPVNVCGVGVGVLGGTSAECATTGGSEPAAAAVPAELVLSPVAPGGASLLGDTAATATAATVAPVDVCGVGVGVLGATSAGCGGPASRPNSSPTVQLDTPLAANTANVTGPTSLTPLRACGIGVGVLGSTSANCGQAATQSPTLPPVDTSPVDRPVTGGAVTPVASPTLDSSERRPVDAVQRFARLAGDPTNFLSAERLAATGSTFGGLVWLAALLIALGAAALAATRRRSLV